MHEHNPEFRCKCCTTPIPFNEKDTEHGLMDVCFQCYDDDKYLQEIKYRLWQSEEENSKFPLR